MEVRPAPFRITDHPPAALCRPRPPGISSLKVSARPHHPLPQDKHQAELAGHSRKASLEPVRPKYSQDYLNLRKARARRVHSVQRRTPPRRLPPAHRQGRWSRRASPLAPPDAVAPSPVLPPRRSRKTSRSSANTPGRTRCARSLRSSLGRLCCAGGKPECVRGWAPDAGEQPGGRQLAAGLWRQREPCRAERIGQRSSP